MENQDLETGTVLETDGKWATVITNKNKACRECGKAEAGICGKKGDGIILKAQNPLNAIKGDRVVLELAAATHIKAYFFAFVLPVIALFAFAFIGSITGVAGLEAGMGLTALVLSLVYSFAKIHRLDKSEKFQITKIIHSPLTSEDGLHSCSEGADYLAAFSRNH